MTGRCTNRYRISGRRVCQGMSCLLLLSGMLSQAIGAEPDADQILRQLGRRQGLVALLGTQQAQRAIALAGNSELLIYVQSPASADVSATRRQVAKAGYYGTRIFIQRGPLAHIHLADNLADAVVTGDAGVPQAELLRVVQPRGLVLQGTSSVTKPVPAGTGEWTHPYHGADNNPQADDQLARAPYLTRFLATPWYGPMPEVTLSSGGRIFKAFGHLAFKEREWPMLGKLVALNGYNGAMLWQRDLQPGFMIHRNTIVATPDILYLADNRSCQMIDTATGKTVGEIVVPEQAGDSPSWKWMTVRGDMLYALVGPPEQLHQVHRGDRKERGWPWSTVRATYGPYQTSWGFGKTLIAMHIPSRKLRWTYRTEHPIDSRALCSNGRQFFLYSHPRFLSAVDASNGKRLWTTSSPELLQAIGKHDPAENPRLGYATSSYAKCNERAIYFAGPQRKKLVAVSAEDGRLLWTHDDGNVQLVLRKDGLYAMGRVNSSKKFDYLTGKILADLKCFRGNCTRATGAVDSIFARGYRHTGTLRFDVHYETPRRLASMRPACQDGVVSANGQLYWGPWMCDCNHSLVGVISLGSAGDFNFSPPVNNRMRLETFPAAVLEPAAITGSDDGWPTYRHDNRRAAATTVSLPSDMQPRWRQTTHTGNQLTAPVTAGDWTFVAGSDGVVLGLETASGRKRWTAYTGGGVRYPPAYWENRVYVGSADGWVYCFEAQTGQRLWRFRVAPAERMIPVYGQLSSTWPVASGVLVQDGVAYAAAGIASHDGTYVCALDAKTGSLKWSNDESGNLIGEKETVGVSVQGHLLFHQNKLYLAGGNVASPAIYDAGTGRCLNQLSHKPEPSKDKPEQPKDKPKPSKDDHWKMQRSSRGSELFLVDNQVVAAGRMLYKPPAKGPDSRYNGRYELQATAGDVIIQGTNQSLRRLSSTKDDKGNPVTTWDTGGFHETMGLALTPTAVLVVGQIAVPAAAAGEAKQQAQPKNKPAAQQPKPAIAALDTSNGKTLWSHALPAPPTRWGLAVDYRGRVIVTLSDGSIVCLTGK